MKLKCRDAEKNTKLSISVDDLSVSQIEQLLTLPKLNEEYSANYKLELKQYNEYMELYTRRIKPITELKERIEIKYNTIWRQIISKYEVIWECLSFNKFKYNQYNPYTNSYSECVLKTGAKKLIPMFEAVGIELRKIIVAENVIKKGFTPPNKPYEKAAVVCLKLKNKTLVISADDNSIEYVLKALEYKNKNQAISAKAAAYDGTQRQLANSIKNDIKKQIHSLSSCPYCGRLLTMDDAHADHIYPVIKGGLSTTRNMIYVCSDCNLKKRDMTLRNFIIKYNSHDSQNI